MISKLVQAAIVSGVLAMGGCTLDQARTSAPANKPPAADYQEAVPPSPPATNIRGIEEIFYNCTVPALSPLPPVSC